VSACTVCAHAELEAIDSALAAGTPLRPLGDRYGLNKDALSRHRRTHMSDALVALTGTVVGGSERQRVRERLEGLFATVEGLITAALDGGKGSQAVSSIREARMLLELIARITGELDERDVQVINLQSAPEWLVVRAAIMTALADHPEARLSVGRGLVELGAAA
jgi:hypothetical protein